jgi:hypothetical protein
MATEDLQPLPREVVQNPQEEEEDITTAAAKEEHSVDELARGLATGMMSRRRVLKVLGGSLAGGLLAVFGVGGGVAAADEGCKPNGKKCRKNAQCCSGNCANGTCAAACVANGGACTAGTQCCSGFCKGGTCAASCIPPEATTCASDEDCPNDCTCDQDPGAFVCHGGGTADIDCTTSCDCPTGQVCLQFPTGGKCVVAC